MEITCKKCGSIFSVDQVGTKKTYVCRKCGTAVSLIEEIAGKKTTAGPQNETSFEGMLKPGQRFRGYRISELIGSGGMGDIYKAKQISMDRIVALKILKKSLSTNKEFTKRFIREARSAGRLNHPNIIQIYDVGREDMIYFFSMEYVEGESLDNIIARKGPFSIREAVTVISAVARALKKAEESGIVHRDIKPANIMVSRQGTIKVADFGLARPLNPDEPSLTQTGVTLGTPYYMAPEQVHGSSEIDIRADIYALGCTLFHLVTGRVPFRGKSTYDILKGHETKPVEFPDNVELPDIIMTVIKKMMAKSPDERFSSAGAVLHALAKVKETISDAESQPKKKKRKRPGRKSLAKKAAVAALVLAFLFILLMILTEEKDPGTSGGADGTEEQGDDTVDAGGDTSSPGDALKREDVPLFCAVTNIRKMISLTAILKRNNLSFFIPGIVMQGLAKKLKITPEIFKQCIDATGPVSVFSTDNRIYSAIELPQDSIDTLFASGFPAEGISDYKGKRIFSGYPGICVMQGDGRIVAAQSPEHAYNVISDGILPKLKSFSEDLRNSFKLERPLALGYVEGDFIRSAAEPGSIPDMDLIRNIAMGMDNTGERSVHARIRIHYTDISKTEIAGARTVPRSLFKESMLPSGGIAYVISYLPEGETLRKLQKIESAKDPGGAGKEQSPFISDIVTVIKGKRVDFIAAGLYAVTKKETMFIAEIRTDEAGILLAGLKSSGYEGAYFRPESKDNGRRRIRHNFMRPKGVTLFDPQSKAYLYAIAVENKVYITNTREGIQRILRMLFKMKVRRPERHRPLYKWPPSLFKENMIAGVVTGVGNNSGTVAIRGNSLVFDIIMSY